MRSILGWAALGFACGAAILPVWADAKTLSGVVFDDRSGDGRRQAGEPGVPDVALSDGRTLVVTDAGGRYRIDAAPGSTVFAIKPAGWRLPGDDPARPGAWRHVPATARVMTRYGGIVAALFAALGIWLGLRFTRPRIEVREVPVEVRVPVTTGFTRDDGQVKRLGITARELEILEAMAAGLSNREIAEATGLSRFTIESHTRNIYRKLAVKSRTAAVHAAREQGLLP